MATVDEYLQTGKLKHSSLLKKAVLAVFHLNNKEVKRELKVNHNNKTLLFWSEPTYLGVTFDRILMYRPHFESLCKKWTSRVALLRRLAGSRWGAAVTTLWTASLALVHSTAGYCAPVWCRSAHTRLIDPATNDTLRTVPGCLHPTPADNLPTLTGIQPAERRRKGATLSLARRPTEPIHLGRNARHLKSRHPFAVPYQPNSAPPKMLPRAPLMVIYKKRYVMLHLEAELTSKKYSNQDRSQPGFEVWGEKCIFMGERL